MPPLAVLFDFDGVIADTENVHISAWERTFAAMGWEVEPETCARSAEEDDRLFLESVFADREIFDGDIAGWVARKQALTLAMLSERPRVYPGAVELINALQNRATLAIVTTTSRANVAALLRSRGLEDAFRVIVAKEDATHPKPDPEPYRKALESLRISPDRAVAIEDSPSGLASALGAGIRTIAVGHRRPKGDWSEPAAGFLPNLIDTPSALAALQHPG